MITPPVACPSIAPYTQIVHLHRRRPTTAAESGAARCARSSLPSSTRRTRCVIRSSPSLWFVFSCSCVRRRVGSGWPFAGFLHFSFVLHTVGMQPLTYPLVLLSPIFPPVPGTGCRPDLRHRSDFARRQHLLHRLVRLVPVGGGPERRDRVLHRRRDLGPPVLRGWPALPPRPLG